MVNIEKKRNQEKHGITLLLNLCNIIWIISKRFVSTWYCHSDAVNKQKLKWSSNPLQNSNYRWFVPSDFMFSEKSCTYAR